MNNKNIYNNNIRLIELCKYVESNEKLPEHRTSLRQFYYGLKKKCGYLLSIRDIKENKCNIVKLMSKNSNT
jgi:hypothetical protein